METAIKNRVQSLKNKQLEESNKKYENYALHDIDPFLSKKRKTSYDRFTTKKKSSKGNNDEEEFFIGIKQGASSFVVDPLHEDWEKERVPREDGREWPDGFEGEGGYFEGKWRTEEDERRRILEEDVNYQFLTFVAGAANTIVEQLYEEGDVASAVRRQQAFLRQQQIALEEVKATTKQVATDVNNLNAEIRNRRDNRKKLRNALVAADRHIQSLSWYSQNYEDERDHEIQLIRKGKIFNQYTKTPFLTDDIMKQIKSSLLEAADFELKKGLLIEDKEEISLLNNIEDVLKKLKEEPTSGNRHLQLSKTLIDLWFFRDDISKYNKFKVELEPIQKEIKRKQYLLFQVAAKGPILKEIEVNQENTLKAEFQLLLRYYDVIFYFDKFDILSIDPHDIYEIPVLETAIKTRRDFDAQYFKDIYNKYGGKVFKVDSPIDIEISDYYTTEFRTVFEDISLKVSKDKKLQKQVVGGPYVLELKIFREWIKPQIEELQRDIQHLEEQLRISKERLTRLRTGKPTFQDLEQPYRHRRQWVEAPEHSGIIRIKPIVVSGIDDAFKMVQRWTSYGKKVGVEFMQHDSQIRGDFARLVSIKMSYQIMRFPKQYLQLGLRKISIQDEYDVVQRLKTGYQIIPKGDNNSEFEAKIISQSEQNQQDNLLKDRRDFFCLY